jgi:hypothetical protein
MKSGNLNFLEPSGPLQACNGSALPLPYAINIPNFSVTVRCILPKMSLTKTTILTAAELFNYGCPLHYCRWFSCPVIVGNSAHNSAAREKLWNFTADIYIYIYIYIYRLSQEECAGLREGVPYVKIYRYNPKHLCPKLNGYWDNGQRKVWISLGSTHCSWQRKRARPSVWYRITYRALSLTCIPSCW